MSERDYGYLFGDGPVPVAVQWNALQLIRELLAEARASGDAEWTSYLMDRERARAAAWAQSVTKGAE